uniref:Protein ENHANCED DISEASE RESISTANCE 2-like isoform X3 n=1 Tax=Rhizophora mucronata TaxID=61149 RepID=A0A2P2JH79_RHIMU
MKDCYGSKPPHKISWNVGYDKARINLVLKSCMSIYFNASALA